MGSQPHDPYILPNAASSSLVVKPADTHQKHSTWTLNFEEWGGALTLDQYLEREPYLTTLPLARCGGMSHWVLTDRAWHSTPDYPDEPVLASAESIRKRLLVAKHRKNCDGGVYIRDCKADGIGSVFTYPRFRGRGYAGRLLAELVPALKGDDVVCSALWSDIGREYYAQKGWTAFPSLHVEFPAAAAADNNANNNASDNTNTDQASNPPIPIKPEDAGKEANNVGTTIVTATLITYDDLKALCERDEALLRAQLLRTSGFTGRTCVAFAPDRDTMLWHFLRDDFITSKIFESPRSPPTTDAPVRGALAGTKDRGRVWALWSRSYGGGVGEDPARTVEKNTLYILRLVIEAEGTRSESADGKDEEDEDVVAAFTAVMRVALQEARTWHLGKIDMWNPSPLAKKLVEHCGLRYRWVERKTDSIPSMMWYGSEDVKKDIEWVANEKYCWC